MTNYPIHSFQTRAVHAGETRPGTQPGEPGGFIPTVAPIHPATSFFYENMENLDAVFAGTGEGYVYSRYGSPSVTALEQAVASLEKAEAAQAYASGMAALHAALLAAGTGTGKPVLAGLDLYGATYTLLKNLLATLGLQARFIDATRLDQVEAEMIKNPPCLLLVETISNPLLKVADLPALAGLAKQFGSALLVDNTFASPFLVNPLQHGADYAIHSVTKYLSGHGDVLAGVTACSTANRQKLFELNKVVGGVLGPFEAWLALRGIKTLPLRMNQHCQNAQRAAEWLKSRSEISRVHYPGLPEHPQHDLANRLFEGKGFGGVLSFEIAGADRDTVFRFMERLKLILPATTLGDIYSLVLHPASSSHRSLTPDERLKAGIPENLVRFSVGIEAIEDILADLEQALKGL